EEDFPLRQEFFLNDRPDRAAAFLLSRRFGRVVIIVVGARERSGESGLEIVKMHRVRTLDIAKRLASDSAHFAGALEFKTASVSDEPWARTALSERISSVAASISFREKTSDSMLRPSNSKVTNSSFASRRTSTRWLRFLMAMPLTVFTT